jgi:hypothetical protein
MRYASCLDVSVKTEWLLALALAASAIVPRTANAQTFFYNEVA